MISLAENVFLVSVTYEKGRECRHNVWPCTARHHGQGHERASSRNFMPTGRPVARMGCVPKRNTSLCTPGILTVRDNGTVAVAACSFHARCRHVSVELETSWRGHAVDAPTFRVVNRNQFINLVGPISIRFGIRKPGRFLYRCTVESTSVRTHAISR